MFWLNFQVAASPTICDEPQSSSIFTLQSQNSQQFCYEAGKEVWGICLKYALSGANITYQVSPIQRSSAHHKKWQKESEPSRSSCSDKRCPRRVCEHYKLRREFHSWATNLKALIHNRTNKYTIHWQRKVIRHQSQRKSVLRNAKLPP